MSAKSLKEYKIKIYEQNFKDVYYSVVVANDWYNKDVLENSMTFDKFVAEKTVYLNSNLPEALNQIKKYLYEYSQPWDAFMVIIDDVAYYYANCSQGSSLSMELCKDRDALAGKLLDCAIRLKKNKGI